MSVSEVAIGLSWITATLQADSQWLALSPGGVKRGALPVGTSTPATIVAFQSGPDVLTANAIRLMSNVLYQIKGVGSSDQTQAVFDLAARIDDLFKRTQGSAPGGIALSCYREAILQLDDNTAGIQYVHSGGLYRVKIQQTS